MRCMVMEEAIVVDFLVVRCGVVCDYRLDRRQVASTRRSHGGPGPPPSAAGAGGLEQSAVDA